MSFNAALTAGQYTKLRSGSYAGDYNLTLCRNTVVFAAQLSAATTGLASWAYINYDTVTTGAYTAIEEGMAILFSTTNDIKMAQRFRGRIRYDHAGDAVATANTIYVNESSNDWPIDTYIWVIYTFDLAQKLSFFDMNRVEYVDYNWPYQADPPIAPTLRTAYVGDCDSVTGKYRVAFDVSDAFATAPNATMSSYLFAFKAATYTVISGSLSTAIVTVDFNPGEQWGKLTLTDSDGTTWIRRFYIHAHDADNPYDAKFEKMSISDNLQQGWSAQATALAGVDDILSNTFAAITRANEVHGGTVYSLSTNNIAFVGWLQREDASLTPDPAVSLLSDSAFQFTGLGARLARLGAQEIGVGFGAPLTAGTWGYNSQATPWRAIIHYLAYYTTALNLGGIDIDLDHKNAGFLFPTIAMTGSNPLDLVQSVAKTINAALTFAPDGRMRLDVDAGHLSQAMRDSLTTVANYTTADCLPVSLTNDLASYGLVDADGMTYNPTSTVVTPFKVRAPGIAMGETQGRGTLTQQILSSTADAVVARNELIQRATNELEILNVGETLTVKFTDGHNYLIASRSQLYTFTLAATLSGTNGVQRIVYTTATKWLLESASLTPIGNGAVDITGTFRKLSRIGDTTGLDMTPGPDSNTGISIPDIAIPAFDFQDPETWWPDDSTALADPPQSPEPVDKIAMFDGSELIVATTTKCFYERKVIYPPHAPASSAPLSLDVTPTDLGSYLIKAVAVNPFYTMTAIPCFLKASDGTNSAVWYTENIAQAAPVWSKGANLAGIYRVLRATYAEGTILAYGPGAAAASGTTTVTFSPGSPLYTVVHGTVIASGGNPGYCLHAAYYAPTRGAVARIDFVASVTVTAMSFDYKSDLVTAYKYVGNSMALYEADGTLIIDIADLSYPDPDTWFSYSATGLSYANVKYAIFSCTNSDLSSDNDKWIDNLSITWQDGPAVSGAVVSCSPNYGATWNSPLAIGTSPGDVGGFDVQRAGANSFAAILDKVVRATQLGGAYVDYYSITGGTAQAACIIVPYFNWSGARQTAAANPDIIVALTAADGSSRSLLWIEGGATPGTVHDITPAAGLVFDHSDSVTVSYEHHIACIGWIDGTYKLYRTTNQGGAWTLVKTLSGSASFIRTRRNDSRAAASGTSRGQVYVADSDVYYSSTWLASGPYVRAQPATPIVCLDTVF